MLTATGLRRRAGDRLLLDDVCLHVGPGRSVCVVGPSGSGKTTLLRALAGLDPLEAGAVSVAGRDVTHVAPHQRGIAMVFQDATLFGELDVAGNIAFGLQGRGASPARAEEKVQLAMLRMGLVGLEHRRPHQLSGGQRRRVSLARALVTEPSVLLLDEPLSGLEGQLRSQFAGQLQRARQRGGTAMVHVTHDEAEALASGDDLVVMSGGRILQHGDPREVYRRPDSAEVAAFLGQSTFVQVPVHRVQGEPGRVRALVGALGVELWVDAHDDWLAGGTPPGEGSLMVRPHAARIRPREQRTPEQAWRADEVYGEVGLVQAEHFLGEHLEHVVETERGNLVVRSPLELGVAPGEVVDVELDPAHCWLLPARRR